MPTSNRPEILTPTKAMTRGTILNFIKRHNPTFGELAKGTRLSKATVWSYVNQLEKEGFITRDLRGRRVVLVLTSQAKHTQQMQMHFFADWLVTVKDLVKDYPLAKTVYELSKAAQKDPALVEEFLMEMNELVVGLHVLSSILPTIKKLTRADWSNVKDKVLDKMPASPARDSDVAGPLIPLGQLLQSIQQTVEAESVVRAARRNNK